MGTWNCENKLKFPATANVPLPFLKRMFFHPVIPSYAKRGMKEKLRIEKILFQTNIQKSLFKKKKEKSKS